MPTCKGCGRFGNVLSIDPCPYCGVKDWLVEKSAHDKPRAAISQDVRDVVGKFAKVVLALILLGFVIYWLTPEKKRLAEQYHISEDAVFIEPKPHGCDFDDAPLGNKHCHYEKAVDTEKVCPGADCRVKAVYVSWRKLED